MDARPGGAPAAHPPQLPVRVPAAVVDPAAQVEDVAADLEAHRARVRRDCREDRVAQVRRAALVGVEREHPVARRLLQGEVLLRGVARPVVVDHPGRRLSRELDGAIGAAGIDDRDLVAPAHAREARLDVRCLVLADDGRGDAGTRHARTRSTESTPWMRWISFITALRLFTSATHRSKVWFAF